MEKAIRERLRTDNPASKIKYASPERFIVIWEQEDLELIANTCVAGGQPGLAALIRCQWEIGQRLGDARRFKAGREYVDGVFRFQQKKTGKYVTIPAPQPLRDLLACRPPDSYLFVDARDGLPFESEQLSNLFASIRDLMPEYKERKLVLQKLRHSCILQLARAGCEIFEIASITGHTYGSVHRILEFYLPRDQVLAWQAIEKRQKMVSGEAAEPLPRPAGRFSRSPGFARPGS